MVIVAIPVAPPLCSFNTIHPSSYRLEKHRIVNILRCKNGLHAFSNNYANNSAKSEPIWVKSETLRVATVRNRSFFQKKTQNLLTKFQAVITPQ